MKHEQELLYCSQRAANYKKCGNCGGIHVSLMARFVCQGIVI